MKKDPRIDEYISALPMWQKQLCQEIRTLIHKAEPAIAETIKFTNRPYFTLEGTARATQIYQHQKSDKQAFI